MTDADKDAQFYRDTESIAFPKLDDNQLALLEPLGKRRIVRPGEILFVAGQRDVGLVIVLSGELEVYETREDAEQILANPGPRDFIGEVSMLNGTAVLASARGKAEQSEILEIPAAALRRALVDLPGVSEPMVNAFIMRRERLRRDPDFAGFRIIAADDSREGHLIHNFLDKNHVPHRLIELESSAGMELCSKYGITPADLPALIAANGQTLCRPSIREVAQIAGLLRPLALQGVTEMLCDVAIVGAGPAGLSAALNSASEGLETVVLESFAPGGQAGSSSLIENFFGFPTGISGGDLTNRALLQAFRLGAKFSTPSRVLSLAFGPGVHGATLQVDGCHAKLRARCVIIATGAVYNRIEAEGRAHFEGTGVYYAATALESPLCSGSEVIVAGGGNSAGQAAMFLSEVASKVYLVIRGDDLNKSMSSYLSHRVEHKDNIEILRHTEIRKMTGGKHLEAVEVENIETHERRTIATPAVFSMIGARPCTGWLPPEIALDDRGFILTGRAVADAPAWKAADRRPGPMETSQPNIFVAGDVRSGSVKRCAAAVGEGGMAIEGVHQSLGTYS